jgi:hypothetical protein
MKKVSIALILSLIIILSVVSSGVAALPGSGWWSSLRVQNISDAEGIITMSAYGKQAATAAILSDAFTVQPASALVYDPGKTPNYPSGNLVGFQENLPSGFEGSVVLSSSAESASVSQIANYTNGTVGGSGKASAMYQGISADMLSTELLATTIKHNYSGATTTLYIQAAGADADVTVSYTMADGSKYAQTENIEANRMFVFDPAAAGVPNTNCGYNTNTSPCYGSAVVTATGDIAGVLLEHPHSGTPVTFIQAIRLQTPVDQSTKIYIPSVKNDFCGSSGCGVAGAAVMNAGLSSANVKITLTVTKLGNNAPSDVKVGDVFTDTASIPAGTNYNFSKWNNNLGGLPEGTLAAAVIESTNGQPLVGSSNDAKTQTDFPGEAKVKYTAYADELATATAYAPMVKEFLGNFTGGVTVQNVGSAADFINIEYHQYGTNNVCTLRTKSKIAPGGAAETNWVSVNGSNRFTLSGNCSSFGWLTGKEFSVKAFTDAGQNIIIMVTENTPDGSLDISRYEGVNK